VVAALPGIGDLITKLEGEERDHARDEVVPLPDAAIRDELGIDVRALEVLDPVPEPTLQAFWMIGGLLGAKEGFQQVTLHGEQRAETVPQVADLLLLLDEPQGVA
jgi:hypothetical protein